MKTTFSKKKVGAGLGFRTPDFFKQSKFSKKGQSAKFNQTQFKTQHRGGS